MVEEMFKECLSLIQKVRAYELPINYIVICNYILC